MSNLTNNKRNKRLQKFNGSYQALTEVNLVRKFQKKFNELTRNDNEKVSFVTNELTINKIVPIFATLQCSTF